MDANVSKVEVEVELSLVWAGENPDLFLDAVAKFRDDHQGWGVKAMLEDL